MAYVYPRRNAEGKIISYCIKVFRGRYANGKQLKPFITTWKIPEGMTSEKKIQKELNKFTIQFEEECKNGYTLNNKQTFEQYANYVLELKERTGTKHNTIALYKRLLQRINPEIGHLKLSEIRPQHLNKLYEQLSKDGLNKVTGGKLSNKTILEHHRLIETVLAQADKEMLVAFNSAKKATPPKIKKTDTGCLELEDVKNILKYVKNEPLKWQLAINLLVYTGCRRGEILGLQWNCIDFDEKYIYIKNNLQYTTDKGIYIETPKTEKSKRFLPMNDELIELLKAYKKEYNQNKLKLGTKWQNSGFIFTQENGKPMHPDSLTDYCNKFRKKYNKIISESNKQNNTNIKQLPYFYPHLFRHTCVSLLIGNGTDIVTVSNLLGHSRPSTTTDIYSHLLNKSKVKAMESLKNVLKEENEIIAKTV